MKRTKAPKAKKISKPRKYNNSYRLEKSNSNRLKIIENYINMLIEKRGDDISLEELAERSELSTRTLFRFFGDKKSLITELETYLEAHINKVSENLHIMTVEEFAEFSFQVFDQSERLISAYLFTNYGQQSRVEFRKKFNAMIMERIKSQIPAITQKNEQHKIQLIITLINANLWQDLRDIYNESGASTGKSVKWAVGTLLKDISA